MYVPPSEGYPQPPNVKALLSQVSFPQVSVSGFLGFVAGRGSVFFSPEIRVHGLFRQVCRGRRSIWAGHARVFAVRAPPPKKTLASYEETVLRALEETEDALASYHAQQAPPHQTEPTRLARASAPPISPACAIEKE